MNHVRRRVSGLLASLLFTADLAIADNGKLSLQRDVDLAREKAGLVALGAVVATADKGIVAVAVSGERAKGGKNPVQDSDAWHIGSNTKMLTALLYARLVEQGHARWGAAVPELFPGLSGKIHANWQEVTIEDLLSHRSGAAPNASVTWMISARFDHKPLDVQRANLAETILASKPAGKHGEFTYSNLGYILAGAAIEDLAKRTPDLKGKTYELLLRELVVAQGPAGAAAGFGFGPPKTGIEGHAKGLLGRTMKPQGRTNDADNPAALGPAGTVHYSLRGHALLLLSFLDGPRALPLSIRKKLLTPYPNANSDYALGWGVAVKNTAHGVSYGHSGSNTVWLSQVTMVPELGLVVIVNTNQMDLKAETTVSELSKRLVEQMSAADK